jgi:hypothetical protein
MTMCMGEGRRQRLPAAVGGSQARARETQATVDRDGKIKVILAREGVKDARGVSL